MLNFLKTFGVTVIAMVMLGACDATPNTPATYDAESYEYKGAADQLLATSGEERAGELADRFDLIQGRK